MNKLSIITLLILGIILLASAEAGCQTTIPLNQPLPRMAWVACRDLDAAIARSHQARSATSADTLNNLDLPDGCRFGPLSVSLKRIVLQNYTAWVQSYSARSTIHLSEQHNGISYRVPVSITRSPVAMYEADIHLSDGRTVRGYVEIPARPYFLEFLRRCSNRRCPQ